MIHVVLNVTSVDHATSASVGVGFCAALNEFGSVLFRDKGRVCMYALHLQWLSSAYACKKLQAIATLCGC
jgi:hypothetical protein